MHDPNAVNVLPALVDKFEALAEGSSAAGAALSEIKIDPPAASRLSAECGECSWTGSRNETFSASKRRGETFQDTCPHCHSDNVDVSDPNVKTEPTT